MKKINNLIREIIKLVKIKNYYYAGLLKIIIGD